MKKLKRTQFWGKDENDDRLIKQIITGKKTATACPSSEYYQSDGDYEDGSFEEGDLVEVYDLKYRLRCIIRITKVYETKFNCIPEELWKGECNLSAEEFQKDHKSCWDSQYKINEDFKIMVNLFELIDVI